MVGHGSDPRVAPLVNVTVLHDPEDDAILVVLDGPVEVYGIEAWEISLSLPVCWFKPWHKTTVVPLPESMVIPG
ncbi:MAG: hypothetical protein ACR2JU_09245 [Nocardioidaceae bacterium]